MSAVNANGAARGAIGTLLGSAVLGIVPWALMKFVKTGDLAAYTAVSTAVFIGVVVGAAFQWWVSKKVV